MQQIRVCRTAQAMLRAGDLFSMGAWIQATPQAIADCAALVEAGNAIFGAGTHWVEKRAVHTDLVYPNEAIKNLIANSMGAWVEGDMDGHVQFFTPGASLADPHGMFHCGRTALKRAFARDARSMPNLRMELENLDILQIHGDMAVARMSGTVLHSGRKTAESWAARQLLSYSERDRWKIASMQVKHHRDQGPGRRRPADPAHDG